MEERIIMNTIANKSKIHKRFETGSNMKKIIYKQRYLFMMVLPVVIIVTIFSYVPVFGWLIAFKDYRPGRDILSADWIGLKQFKMFFLDSKDALYIFRNTLSINILCLIFNLTFACMFAILVNEIKSNKIKSIIQTFSLFPFFISWVVVYSIYTVFFSVNSGVINIFLINIGVIKEGINLLGDPKYAWGLMVITALWKSMGYNAIIFLASISGIEQEQYEAAEIDGAGRWGRMWYITLPGLKSTFIVLLILTSGSLLSTDFDKYYLFTNPTNIEKMEVFDMYTYRYGMKLANFSYSTAVSMMKTIISIGMLLGVNTLSKKVTERSLF